MEVPLIVLVPLSLVVPQPPAVELVVRAWWSFAEELALTWTGTQPSTRDTLVALLVRTLHQVIDAASE